MTTDTIADMLTQIRNAVRNKRADVSVPFTKVSRQLADVLKREGYVQDFAEEGEGVARRLRVRLKYGPLGEQVIQRIQRVSSPGRRFYRGVDEIPKVMDGLGILVVSTPKGLLSDREARRQRVGGELVCKVW